MSVRSCNDVFHFLFCNTGAYEKMTSFKKMYPHLKVLISMGGWAERINKNYSIVAESPFKRKELVASIVHFIRLDNVCYWKR